ADPGPRACRGVAPPVPAGQAVCRSCRWPVAPARVGGGHAPYAGASAAVALASAVVVAWAGNAATHSAMAACTGMPTCTPSVAAWANMAALVPLCHATLAPGARHARCVATVQVARAAALPRLAPTAAAWAACHAALVRYGPACVAAA